MIVWQRDQTRNKNNSSTDHTEPTDNLQSRTKTKNNHQSVQLLQHLGTQRNLVLFIALPYTVLWEIQVTDIKRCIHFSSPTTRIPSGIWSHLYGWIVTTRLPSIWVPPDVFCHRQKHDYLSRASQRRKARLKNHMVTDFDRFISTSLEVWFIEVFQISKIHLQAS